MIFPSHISRLKCHECVHTFSMTFTRYKRYDERRHPLFYASTTKPVARNDFVRIVIADIFK